MACIFMQLGMNQCWRLKQMPMENAVPEKLKLQPASEII